MAYVFYTTYTGENPKAYELKNQNAVHYSELDGNCKGTAKAFF